ncbi:MAG: DUF2190 family protein [Methylovulum sp.]|nr:DUF2190 family protein [Methylovulum sp.]
MARNYVQDGCVLSWHNSTAAAVTSGEPVVFGSLGMAIALVDIAVGNFGSVQMEGVFSLAKAAGAIDQGDKLWWSYATKKVTNAPTLNGYFIGYASESAASSDDTVNVYLEEFDSEGARVLTLAATGTQSLGVGDLLSGELVVLVPNTAAKTVNLPSVGLIPSGAKLFVKKTSADAFAVSLDPAGAETIAAGASYTDINANNDNAHFINTGSAWALLVANIN